MPHKPFFPITANPTWMFGIFVVFLVIFHLLFLKVWKLTEKSWKIVDYCWLGFAVLGLLAGTAEVRKLTAQSQLALEETYMISTYESLRREIRFLQGPAVCRKFNRTAYSPKNLDDIQTEYDKICSFAKDLNGRLPTEPPTDLQALKFDSHPKVTDAALTDMLNDLDMFARKYIEARKSYDQTEASQKSTDAEITLFLSGPLLLSIALALRITKVTGELQLRSNQ